MKKIMIDQQAELCLCLQCDQWIAKTFFITQHQICENCIEDKINEIFSSAGGKQFIKLLNRDQYKQLEEAVAAHIIKTISI